MNPQTWWYMTRASGMIAWLVLGATCLWGILLITRMLKPADRPAWLLDLHRWLGALADRHDRDSSAAPSSPTTTCTSAGGSCSSPNG